MSTEVLISGAKEGDGEQVRSLLEAWVRDPVTNKPIHEEIDSVISSIEESAKGEGDRKYFIARHAGGGVLGLMGYTSPGETMQGYAGTDNPAELINAYVDPDARGSGVGTALADVIEADAYTAGHTEIMLNSGPRYKESGHGFYRKRYGEPSATAKDMYGPGNDAPVWTRKLESN